MPLLFDEISRPSIQIYTPRMQNFAVYRPAKGIYAHLLLAEGKKKHIFIYWHVRWADKTHPPLRIAISSNSLKKLIAFKELLGKHGRVTRKRAQKFKDGRKAPMKAYEREFRKKGLLKKPIIIYYGDFDKYDKKKKEIRKARKL